MLPLGQVDPDHQARAAFRPAQADQDEALPGAETDPVPGQGDQVARSPAHDGLHASSLGARAAPLRGPDRRPVDDVDDRPACGVTLERSSAERRWCPALGVSARRTDQVTSPTTVRLGHAPLESRQRSRLGHQAADQPDDHHGVVTEPEQRHDASGTKSIGDTT